MRDLKFACPHCEQHIKCDDAFTGQRLACPACGREVTVPPLPDEHHLRITTGKVPVPTHAHGAPRAAGFATPEPLPAPVPRVRYSRYAIASISLAAGSLVLGPFGCVGGIIFGHLAQAELRREPALEGAGLAKSGLLISYAFLVLFAMLGVWLTLKLAHSH